MRPRRLKVGGRDVVQDKLLQRRAVLFRAVQPSARVDKLLQCSMVNLPQLFVGLRQLRESKWKVDSGEGERGGGLGNCAVRLRFRVKMTNLAWALRAVCASETGHA